MHHATQTAQNIGIIIHEQDAGFRPRPPFELRQTR
jgi:hypothetical protein